MTDKGATFDKRVEFKALDGERRVAIGGVMVPRKVDHQGDWVTRDLIEAFSDGFMTRLQSADGAAAPGVMHSVFPEDHVSLAENRVLDEAQEIGGKEFPAGSWIQGWKFEDDELWALVQDDVLSGYSIGASDVEWSEPSAQDDLPDNVDVADAYPEDEPTWQILDGTVHEVSSVDIPAVPDAVMVAAKAGGGAKSILEHVDGKNEFVGVMEDRGHTEDAAERLWHYLQRAMDETDGKAAPTPDKGLIARMGKAAWNAIAGDGPSDSGSKQTAADGGTAKESRTLSAANQERLMAAHDAIEDALASDVEFAGNRFTDSPLTDFDVADYDGKMAADDAGDEDGPTGKNAPDGDTSDDTTMSNDDTDIEEKLESLEKRLEEMEAQADKDDDPDGDADKDTGGDSDLEAKVDALSNQIENLADAAGKSQQLGGGDGSEDTKSTADLLGIPGGDE